MHSAGSVGRFFGMVRTMTSGLMESVRKRSLATNGINEKLARTILRRAERKI
jgi:hypothetical protein